MKKINKSREQLLKELEKSNTKIAELEKFKTERKQAEKALRESEQFMTSLFESVQDGISVLKTDLTIRHVNGIMNKWYKENIPLEGKKCYKVYHNADKPCDPCPTLRCLESGSTEWNVVPGLPGSSIEWIELFSYPIKDPNSGKVTGVVEFVRDITERKKAEEEVKKNFKQQKLLTEISYLFTKLGKFEENMNEVLRLFGEYTKVSRVYVFEDFNNGEYTKNTYEWCKKNIEPQIDNLQEVPYKIIPSWKKILIEKGMVLSSNILELPQDLIDILEPQKIKSVFVLPIYVRNQLFGFMGFDECEKHRIWDKNEIELLKTVTNIISTLFERSYAEETIKESESNLRQIIDLVPHFIFVKDENGKFLIVNKAVADAYGTSVDKLIGKKDTDFASNKEEAEGFVMHDRMVIQSGKQLFIPEEQITDSKGNIRYLQTTKIPFEKAMTEQPAILGVAVDITNRKKAEEEIIKLSTAVKQSPSVIAITDLKGNLEYVNPKFTELTGYSSEEVIGQNPRILKSGELPDDIYKELWDTISSGKKWRGEFYNKKKNGEFFWESVSISPIFDKQDKITNYIKIAEDITERKKAEEELTKHREHLEELVEKRTHELEKSQNSLTLILEDVNEINQDLRNANTMLDATNKELEAFSYSVSHDLRAPLTRMEGFSKALLTNYSGKLDDKGVHYLNRITASSQHMAKLIDNLLSLSRITRGIVTRQKVDLSQTITKIAEELKASEPDKEVEFKIAKGLYAKADRKIVEILLENLLGNSFKFTGKKENAVIEFGEKIIDNKGFFFIKDNGIGFNMKYCDKIFNVFQRLHSEEEYEGTGIGLAIAQRIINRHGGKIWGESEEGKGATFFFRFE